LPYFGWRIFACYIEDIDRDRESEQSLLQWLRGRFSGDSWLVENENGGLIIGHLETNFETTVKISANELGTEGSKVGPFLISMDSECLSSEIKHKKFMRTVLRQLPYKWLRAGCYVQQGYLMLAWVSWFSSSFEPFPVEVTPWVELPIPKAPPKSKFVRTHVVKHPVKHAKQRGKTNTIKELMEAFDRENASQQTKSYRSSQQTTK
jgi:hypothetical protein